MRTSARPTVGIPKGALFRSVIAILEAGGLPITFEGRSVVARPTEVGPTFVLLKPRDIGTLLADGRLCLGFTGLDVVAEAAAARGVKAADELIDLRSTRQLGKGVEWTLAAPRSLGAASFADVSRATAPRQPRVATELPRVTRLWLSTMGTRAEVILTTGATEAFAPLFADAILDVVDSGASLAANSLEPLAVVLASTARLWMSIGRASSDEVVATGCELRAICAGGLAALGIVRHDARSGIARKPSPLCQGEVRQILPLDY